MGRVVLGGPSVPAYSTILAAKHPATSCSSLYRVHVPLVRVLVVDVVVVCVVVVVVAAAIFVSAVVAVV